MSEENRQDKTQAAALLARAEQLCTEYFQTLSSGFNSAIIENTEFFLAGNRRAIIEISFNSLIHTETKHSLLWYFTQHMGLSELALEHLRANGNAQHDYPRQQREDAVSTALDETLEDYKKVFAAELFALELRFRSLRKHAAARTNAEPWVPSYVYSVFRLWLRDMGLGDKFTFELLKFFDQSFCESYAHFLFSLNRLFSDADVLPTTFSAHHELEPNAPALTENFRSFEALFSDAQWEVTKAPPQAGSVNKKTHGTSNQASKLAPPQTPSPTNNDLRSGQSPAEEPEQTTPPERPTAIKNIPSAVHHDDEGGIGRKASQPKNNSDPTHGQVATAAHPPRATGQDPLADIDRGTVLEFLDNANNWQRRKVISFDRDTHEYLLAGNGTQEHRSEAELMELYQAEKLKILRPSDVPKGLYARIKARLQARKAGSEIDAQRRKSPEKTSL